METVDIVLGLFIATLALMGLRSGLIHESVTLLGLGLGLFVAGRLNERLGALFLPWLHTRGMANLAAFLLILFATWTVALFVSAILRDILRSMRLGWLDNVGGAIFGIVKGLFLAEIAILVLMVLPFKELHDAIMRAWLGSRLASLAPDVLELVPPVLRYWKPF